MSKKAPNAKELRGMPEADLKTQLETLRQELWQSRAKARQGALQQTHLLRSLRRQIARAQTVLGQPR